MRKNKCKHWIGCFVKYERATWVRGWRGVLRGFCILLLLGVLVSGRPEGCLQLDVLLVGDMSQSVSGNEAFVASAFNSFVDKFELKEDGVRIGAIVFNSRAWIICHLSADKKEVGGNVQALDREMAAGTTEMLTALYKCVEEFEKNGRPNVKRIIVLVSDGAAQDQTMSKLAAGQLKLIGIDICSIIIIDADTDETFMEQIASPGCYVESYYQQLPDKLKSLDICI